MTGTGVLTLADARELVSLLDTGDDFERNLGDVVQTVRSSADLPNLAVLFELAKRTRVVRVVKGKLVRVAKAASLMKNALALWTAAFDAIPEPSLLVKDSGWAPGYAVLLDDNLDIVLPDVFNTLYGLPEPLPLVRLVESVWLACTEGVYLDLEPPLEPLWRDGLATVFRHLLTKLAEFGTVELTVGPADPMYRMDLVPENTELPPDVQDRLRAELDAPELDLVAFTPAGNPGGPGAAAARRSVRALGG